MAEGSSTVEGGSEAGGIGTSASDQAVLAADVGTIEEGVWTPVRSGLLARSGQRGMVSAEWAVGLIAAIAIAGVLIAIVTNGRVEEELLEFILTVIKRFSIYLGER